METRSKTKPKENPIEEANCFVGISTEEKILADTALKGQKNEVDPVSPDDTNAAILNEEDTELDQVTSDDSNETSSGISTISTYILGFGGFFVTCLVAILLYFYS